MYAGGVALALTCARRWVRSIPRRTALLLALLPLVFTGKALLLGRLYGPADLYFGYEPWKQIASREGVERIANPVLSDLAFANLPWRAAVREAFANGRLPFWNRFVLSGTPLLASVQAGVFHPSTWLGIMLPVPLSWTFSCGFTIFLGLLAGYLYFADIGLSSVAATIGAIGWGFSTYLLFWNGWSIGPSVAALPLLLLGFRRIARGTPGGLGLSVAALLLCFAGGHPETFAHCLLVSAAGFLWETFSHRRQPGRAVIRAAGAGALALLLAGPQLFPLLEAIPHSAEYRVRRDVLASGRATQSVGTDEAARRLLPAVLPFAHGIYGRSPVQSDRADGSGMPLAYSGAILFPFAVLALFSRRFRSRGRVWFAALAIAGLLLGASAPGLIDVITRLPGLSLALNYRLVFLAALGVAGLAAFGAEEILRGASGAALLRATVSCLLVLLAVFALSVGVFRSRGLPVSFVRSALAFELFPLLILAIAPVLVARLRAAPLLGVAVVLLVAQRALEMGGVYPTLRPALLAPPIPGLEAVSAGEPFRVVATGDTFRPNGAALYGLQDARGYESLVLDRFADTYPLWSEPQFASFNRVDRLDRPFLSFLNARFAAADPGASSPAGWIERARTGVVTVFENASALPRAFVPARVRPLPAAEVLAEMKGASDFSSAVWLDAAGREPETANPAAVASVRESGPDLVVTVSSSEQVLIATSLSDWPGWTARAGGRLLPTVTVNHAFVGFRAPAGETTVRLSYAPPSWPLALGAFALGACVCLAIAVRNQRQRERIEGRMTEASPSR